MHPRHRRTGSRTGRPRRDLRRVVASLLGVAVVVLLLGWWRAPGEAPQPAASPRTESAHSGVSAGATQTANVRAAGVRDAAAVLRDPRAEPGAVLAAWDTARARAYARGSARALAGLYLPDAVAGRRDARLLADYVARGLRVRDMRMAVSRLEVVSDRPQSQVLRVTDRLVGARAVRADGTAYPLPRDRASTRTVRLVHHEGLWRVAAVGPAE